MWAEPRGPKIFVAEDDEACRDLLTTRLALAGYAVSSARDGVQALHAIWDCRPAGVVLDINMPRMDGFEVLSSMRQRRDTANTPVLMLTARSAPEDIRRAIKLGARDYLTKPFDDAQLLARVARLIRQVPAC